MRRESVTHILAAGIGALFWIAAILLPSVPQAMAQSSLMPHFKHGALANPVAAEVREAYLAGRDVNRELQCLALNVYWEARGEPVDGRYAVAAVTLNRVINDSFPDSICGVVKQGVSLGRNRCQFSWACDRRGDRPRDGDAWEDAKDVAYSVLFRDHPDPTDGALYFHAKRVRPKWSRTMVKVGRIGSHVYYRQPMNVENDYDRNRS
jgi:spore germination cell wall hydrolase CwlJ-like protein